MEAPANLGKVSPVIISCVGSLKFKALVPIGDFVEEMGTTPGRWRDLKIKYFYVRYI